MSLSLSVLAGFAVGVVIGLALVAFSAEYLSQMVIFLRRVFGHAGAAAVEGRAAVVLPRPEAGQIAGMLGAGTAAMMSVLCLLLARYWQAALYNPGGFGEEFRALQYSPPVSAGAGCRGHRPLGAWRTVPHMGNDLPSSADVCGAWP